jgi:hypothetical protein
VTETPLRELPVPGARYALTAFAPAAPVLRVRYRAGVTVSGLGFPVWTPYARAIVAVPEVPAGRGVDEMRVLDVLIAGAALAAAGSPLAAADGPTPAGWTWAHVAGTRQLALVPADLHASFAHLGGVSTMPADRSRRGIDTASAAAPRPVAQYSAASLPEAALPPVEAALGYRLPDGYREFLLATNGARPAEPAVHPCHGFVADQYLFGLARQDWITDLVYANGWFADRLTADFLALGHVQGGLLALKVRGADRGSVWYLDDDDPRDADTFDATYRCAHLLHRLADDFGQFWDQLRPVPYWLRRLASDVVAAGAGYPVNVPEAGRDLPRSLRTDQRAHEPPALVTG